MTQTAPKDTPNIDWSTLGFSYIRTDLRYLSHWKDGAWDAGTLTEDNVLHIAEGSTALHYGQQCFEGLKAYRCQDGVHQCLPPGPERRPYAPQLPPRADARDQ